MKNEANHGDANHVRAPFDLETSPSGVVIRFVPDPRSTNNVSWWMGFWTLNQLGHEPNQFEVFINFPPQLLAGVAGVEKVTQEGIWLRCDGQDVRQRLHFIPWASVAWLTTTS